MDPAPPLAGGFDITRHKEILETGRVLMRGEESVVAMDGPLLLAAHSEGKILELAIRRVTTFAFVLCGIIGTLVITRIAPSLLGVIVVVWLCGAIGARVFVRRRAHQHGRIFIDFDGSTLRAHTRAGTDLEAPLDRCRVRTERSGDADEPVWIFVSWDDHLLRLGRGAEEDVNRVLMVLRKHRLPVARGE